MDQHPPDPNELTGWADIADTLTQLPVIIRAHRRTRNLSLRQAARQVGVAASSIARIEAGDDLPNADTLIKLIRWLDGQTAPDNPA
jgi:DNA-binding XRE family transcriptional regulator